MQMIKKKTALAVVIVILLALLVSCSNSEAEVESVSIRLNSFKSEYEVDEELSLTNAYVIVTDTDGKNKSVKIEPAMVKGFSTETTGTRELYVEYEGVKSALVSYNTVYTHDASVEINTASRVMITEREYATGAQYEIAYKAAGARADAIKLTLKSADYADELNINEQNIFISTDLTGWEKEYKVVSSKEVSVLLYKTAGDSLEADAVILTVIITDNKAVGKDVILDDVTTADGTKNYYLPYAEKGEK